MLGLKLPTDPRWVNIAQKTIEEILVDHAWCEQKAASACISLIVNFYDYTELVEVLTPVVQEEWAHFEMVLNELEKRNYKLGKPRNDEYVQNLQKHKIKGSSKNHRLVDELLINALIEARSCERFRLLSLHLEDEYLCKFYHKLMKSEANHYVNFVNLAKSYLSENYVKKRLDEFLEIEAQIIKNIEIRGDRMH